jgi:hypothetical protein
MIKRSIKVLPIVLVSLIAALTFSGCKKTKEKVINNSDDDSKTNHPIKTDTDLSGRWKTKLLSKDGNGDWQFNTLKVGGKTWNIGEFDFSYAGYKYNDQAYGTGVPIKIITIEASIGEDITDKINEAVNTLKSTSGGIVKIPAGSFKLGTNRKVAKVTCDNVIIRGAGKDATLLTVDSTYGSSDDFSIGAIQFGGDYSWKDATPLNHPELSFTTVASDIVKGSRSVTVADAASFSVGDYINIRQQQWPAFNAQFFNGTASLLTNNSYAFHYLRRIVDKKGNTITLDIPLDLDLSPANKIIDFYKVDSFFVKNVGLEALSIDVMANGTITYDASGKKVIKNTNTGTAVAFTGVWNGWAKDVKLTNINSLGFAASYSSGLTFDSCSVDTARNRNGGGSGYGYYIKAQNLLYINSSANEVRHGFTTANPVTSNIVIKNCRSSNLGFDAGLAGEAVDDTHIGFAHGILFDNHHMDASGLFMFYRGSLSTNAFHTCGWAVVWNVYDSARNPNKMHQDEIKITPGLYAYVIGVHGGEDLKIYDGAQRDPDVTGQIEKDPALHVGSFANKVLYEGIGLPGLEPSSLYDIMYKMRSHKTDIAK